MPGTSSASRKDPDSNHIESEICESLVKPTEITNANATSQSTTSLAQGDLLQEYGRKFEEHPDYQKLSKRCTDAGFFKEIGKGQFFITIEEGSEVMQTACRDYTTSKLHNIQTERVDSFKYENRPSLWCAILSSRRTLLC